MGGLHLFKRNSEGTRHDDQNISRIEDTPLHPLCLSDLKVGQNPYLFVMPTEEEINDRGKSNWLAKSLVLLQTSWFVMQCIARAIKHLPVTHLEIVTLAYAAMNFVIYVFWWNKPLNVNRPIRVFRKWDSADGHGSEESETQSLVEEQISETRGNSLETIYRIIVGFQDDDVILSRKDRVPRFWADNNSDDVVIADFIVLGVGVCFGAIHCIAWFFSFPTHVELLIWRISSVAITAVPIYMPSMVLLGSWLENRDLERPAVTVYLFSLVPAGILYIIARAATLVLASLSLRDLPPGAYETVHWTTFIPHV